MNYKEKLQLLQLLYAGELTDKLVLFERQGQIAELKIRRKLENKFSAEGLMKQLNLKKPADIFRFYSEVFGFSHWQAEKNGKVLQFICRSCKLKDIAKTVGTVNPCELYCITPVANLLLVLIPAYELKALQTLWNDNSCIFSLNKIKEMML